MKNYFFNLVKDFRYERKFYIEDLSVDEVELLLKFHPAIFREIYFERRINNIYFDTFNLEHLSDSVNGTNRRLKVRIRWYGTLNGLIEKPVLELKYKDNLSVGKLAYPLKPFMFDTNFSKSTVSQIFHESKLDQALKLYLKKLQPALVNRYKRKYFLSSDSKYRVTLDHEMQTYRNLSGKLNILRKSGNNYASVLELKYNESQDQNADEITNHFSFRMTKSSKYVQGFNVFSN